MNEASLRRRVWTKVPSPMRKGIVVARRAALRGSLPAMLQRQVIHCMGDSHTIALKEVVKRGLLQRTLLDVTMVEGATAFGLANPNSRTNALELFSSEVATLPRRHPLLFMLGEVDCGFLIWRRAASHGRPVEDVMHESLSNYIGFLEGLLSEQRRLIISPVPPPTITDYHTWERRLLRDGVDATIDQRRSLTLRYNHLLREWCAVNGSDFLDIALTDENGVAIPGLVQPGQRDHHLAPGPFSEALADGLRRLGFE